MNTKHRGGNIRRLLVG